CLVGGCGMLVPHKYHGVSLFDRLRAVQDAKTPVVRSIIDGTQLSSNPRIGVLTGQVNLDDLLTSRTGGAVRMDTPQSVVPLPNPEIPQSSYTMLNYMDEIRSERGGSAIDTSAETQKVAGDTAHGIERVLSAMELNNATIARTVGETLVRGIFIQIHNLLRKHYVGGLKARIGGRWIESEPSTWKERTNVSVQIGSSHAERARQANVLNGVVQEQKELMQLGSPLVDEAGMYEAMTRSMSLAGVKSPENYITDPESPEGQQKMQEHQQEQERLKQQQEGMQQMAFKSQQDLAQAEILKGQADMQANMVKLETERAKLESDNQIALLKLQLEQQKQELDGLKSGTSQAFDYDKLAADVALKITELEVQANRDLSQQTEENRP
nr:hypothetical protein [bacterium]